MGIGREVADAYIDVHGDLSSFRRDLNDLSGAEDAAIKNADKFTKAWADRIESDVNGKWASIVDAMYSDKKIDWDQLIGAFDGRSLDDANEKITEFMDKMRAGGKLTQKQFEDAKKAIDGQIGSMRDAAKVTDRLEQETRGLGMAADANRKLFAEANAENEKWARTYEGMFKNNKLSDMAEDFKSITRAMNDADWSKFTKGFDSLTDASRRVREVTAAMHDQNRITDEQTAAVQRSVDAFIQGENDKAKAKQDALDLTKRLKDAQDKYNASLSGMSRTFHFAELEGQFKRLSAAMDSNDWSSLSRGAKNMDDFRRRTMETATEMHRLGRMTDQELKLVSNRLTHVSQNMRAFNVQFASANNNARTFGSTMRTALTRTSNLFTRLNNITRGFREHLGGFAGMNVFGDMISKGLDFVHNLDRIALSLGKNTILLSSMASVGASAFAGLVTMGADLGAVIGGLAVALPAFMVGAGIGIGVLVAAMKDMETVLADLKPAFAELQNQISSSFWTEAAGPIREMVQTLMPILTPKLKGTATALGGLVGKLAKAFKDIPADKINDMFDRMNEAVDILGNAMAPLVRAFTTLGDVGSKYFTRFSTWLVKLSDQFDDFIQRSAANGDLDKWINNMIEGFKDIGRAIDGAMGIFNALNTAAERAGFGGLKTFADALQRAAAIMQTPEFQTTLITYLDGARDLAIKLGTAIRDLGPAFESFAPTANTALNNIGDAVKKLIGYVGEIFSNPTFQKGVEDFTGSLATAVEKLQPAIKPFGDSLGQALTLLGLIAVSVAEIGTAFFVHVSPVLDSMSAKLSTLIDPLKNTALNFITEMEGPLKALDEQFIGPLVTGFNEKLLPAINRFIDEFGPFATKVIEELGPSFKILVDEVLPNFVDLATELLPPLAGLVTLLSPSLAIVVQAIADAIKNLTNDIKVLKGELPITELTIFKAFRPEQIQSQIERESVKPETWRDILAVFFTQNIGTGIGLAWTEKIWPAIVRADDYVWDQAAKAIDMLFTGHGTDTSQAKENRDWVASLFGIPDADKFDKDVNQFFEDQVFRPTREIGPELGRMWDSTVGKLWDDIWKPGGGADQLDATVNTWLKDNVAAPFDNAVKEAGKLIPESFTKDVNEWGLIPAIGNHFTNVIGPDIGKAFDDGWKSVEDGIKAAPKNWGDFWNSFGDGMSKANSDVTDFNKTVNDALEKNVWKPLRDAWDNAWKTISNWWNGGGDSGGGGGRGDNNGQQAWTDFWAGFGGMWNDMGASGSDFDKTVNDFLDTNVWKPIGDFFKNLDWGKIGDDLWNGFVDGVSTATGVKWKKVAEGFTGWVEDIKEFFGIHSPSTLMFDMASDVVTGFLNGFGDFAKMVGEKWEEIKTAIGTKFEEIKTALGTWIEDRKTDWNNFWTSFGETIGTKWEEFKTTLATKFEEVKTALTTWIEERKTDWNNFWTTFGETIATKWEEFKTTLSTKWEEIKTNINLWIEERKADWSAFWTSFGETISTKWDEFKTTLATKWEEIKTSINTWIEERKTDWTNFWTAFGTIVNTKWEEFKASIKTKLQEIADNVNTWIEDRKTDWTNFWTAFGAIVKTKWEEFRATIKTKIDEIKNNINTWIEDRKADWSRFWTSIGDTVRVKWDEFKATITTKYTEIKNNIDGFIRDVKINWDNFWAGLGTTITNAFGGVNLWTQGWSIIQGFWSGLLAAWGQVTEWVGGIANWIAENKGPLEYDRKLLVPAGKAIMQGLGTGLRSEMDPLLNTLQTITAAVTDTVTADLSKSVMYATGKDAAQGLADGLKANRTSVHTALGNLGAFTVPSSQITVGGASAVGRPSADVGPSRSLTIAEGAIRIETPTKSPELVAAKVIDSFVNYSTF